MNLRNIEHSLEGDDQRNEVNLCWSQNPSEINGDHLNNIRRKQADISGIKRGRNVWRIKRMSLKRTVRIWTSETWTANCLQMPTVFWTGARTTLASEVRQIEMSAVAQQEDTEGSTPSQLSPGCTQSPDTQQTKQCSSSLELSWVYLTADGQSTSSSWYRAPLWGPLPDFILSFL
jgi:hypothetical protein